MRRMSVLHQNDGGIVSVLHQNEGVLGNGWMDFLIPPEFWWSKDILLIINSSTGMDQEIHPCGQGRIDSVKINPSLLRMRECPMLLMIIAIAITSAIFHKLTGKLKP